MLAFFCSYHQVSPGFLYHIFPFGEQDYPRDFHFISFTQDNTIKECDRGLQYSRLGRSGLELRLAYTMKSVEKSLHQRKLPWSVRQIAVYHAFDLVSGQSTWIIVKGNKSMEERIARFTKTDRNMKTMQSRFISNLDMHLNFCRLTIENWSGYISDLEKSFQMTTKGPTYTYMNQGKWRQRETASNTLSRGTTLRADEWPLSRKGTMSSLGTGISKFSSLFSNDWKQTIFKSEHEKDKADENSIDSADVPAHSNSRRRPPELHSAQHALGDKAIKEDPFSLNDLRSTQQLEEKIQEALVVATLNQKVLQAIRRYYDTLWKSRDMPSDLRLEEIKDFTNEVLDIEENLDMIITRLQALLSMIQDRQQMVIVSLFNSNRTMLKFN
jgi:hypothetical protein